MSLSADVMSPVPLRPVHERPRQSDRRRGDREPDLPGGPLTATLDTTRTEPADLPATTSTEVVRVIVAEPRALVRAATRLIIDATEGMEVVADADAPAALRTAIAVDDPDVVVIVVAPGADPSAWLATCPPTGPRVVLVGDTLADGPAASWIARGVAAVLSDDLGTNALTDAIRVVAAGYVVLDPRLAADLATREVERRSARDRSAQLLDTLSEREHEVLTLIGRGFSNAEIAVAMFVSPATVKTHVSNVLTKLALPNRVHAAILAHQLAPRSRPHEPGRSVDLPDQYQ